MGLPGHRRTSSHKRRRAAHFALAQVSVSHCSHCSKTILPHHVCNFCGYYKGKEVVKKKIKVKK